MSNPENAKSVVEEALGRIRAIVTEVIPIDEEAERKADEWARRQRARTSSPLSPKPGEPA